MFEFSPGLRMTRFLIVAVSLVAHFGVVLATDAAEKEFVHFGTGKVVTEIPPGQDDSFGLIVNKRHPANDLEPIALGNFWLYETRSKVDGHTGRYVVRTSRQVNRNDETWYEYKIDNEFGDDVEPYYLRLGSDAVYYQNGDKPPHKWISRRPTKGETHTNEGGTFTVTEVGKLVDSHWGELKCVELVHEHDQDVEDEHGTVTGQKMVKDIYWYHPGMGVIAIISEDSRDLLIGFNVSN